MKKLLKAFIIMAFPMNLIAGITLQDLNRGPSNISIPSKFSSSSETAVLEWGCPVSEVVDAKSGEEAIKIIGNECLAEARRQAADKPQTFEIISASVIWEDLKVRVVKGGYELIGTVFLETVALLEAGHHGR